MTTDMMSLRAMMEKSRDADPDSARGIDVVSCGVRGDAVGCFLSR